MGLALRSPVRQFTLHIRCMNCLMESSRTLDVNGMDCPPSDADELLESGLVESLSFSCQRCESVIGRLYGIGMERCHEPG